MAFKFGSKRKKDADSEVDELETDDVEMDDAADEDDAPEADSSSKSKAKKKSSNGSSPNFLVQHCEKIALVLVAALAGYIVFSGIGKLKEPRGVSPISLQKIDERIKDKLASKRIPKPDIIDFDQDSPHLDPVAYQTLKVHRDVSPRTKRGQPNLLPVQSVEVKADFRHLLVKKKSSYRAKHPWPREVIRLYTLDQITSWENRHSNLADPGNKKGKKEKKTDSDPGDDSSGGASESASVSANYFVGGIDRPKNADDEDTDESESESTLFADPRPFAVITALLPFEEQQEEYYRQFANAHGYDALRDQPLYREVVISRIRIKPGDDESKLDWTKAKKYTRSTMKKTFLREQSTWWDKRTPEVVAQNFLHSDKNKKVMILTANRKKSIPIPGGQLTKPLAPSLLGDWRELGTHSQVPLYSARRLDDDKRNQKDKKSTKSTPAPQPEPTVEEEWDPLDELAPMATAAVPQKPVTEAPKEPVAPERHTAQKLVRLFDFEVQPGARYCYRVKLILINPNSSRIPNIKDAHVEYPERRTKVEIETEWSEPSAIIQIPFPEAVFAGLMNPLKNRIPLDAKKGPKKGARKSAKKEENPSGPHASVVVRKIDLKEGHLMKEAKMILYRGSMASGVATVYSVNPMTRMVERQKKTGLRTGVTLLDLHGDNRAYHPSELLFVDDQGNLFTRETKTDRKTFNRHNDLESAFRRKAGPTRPKNPGGSRKKIKDDSELLK